MVGNGACSILDGQKRKGGSMKNQVIKWVIIVVLCVFCLVATSYAQGTFDAIYTIEISTPTYVAFYAGEKLVGKLYLEEPMRFEGDVEESARLFFEYVIRQCPPKKGGVK
jgi:hypothetical protein